MDTKTLIQSKTFWLNALFLIVSVAGVFGFKTFEPSMETERLVDAVVAILNIILRLYTTKPIEKAL
jgi:hypothetical protein